MYKFLIRPILFSISPERVHHLVFKFLKFSFKIPFVSKLVSSYFCTHDSRLQRTVVGIQFPNPVGLAAGFDKDAKLVNELSCLGFGFIEIGTVTPLPQPGNPLPRMFRLPEDSALINRMGFNNEGVVEAAKRLKKRNKHIIIGGNIGKNKTTPNENAADDYVKCFDALYEVVDYFVVNVSSPNTPDLRSLQDKEPLTALLTRLKELASTKPLVKPILLKIAPDLSNQQLDEIIEIVMQLKIDGIIATNTTIERTHLLSDKELITSMGTGGLSGRPLRKRSTEVVKYISVKSNGKLPIIAVGGIHSAKDALEKLNAGATLVQLYTGFIYEGPSLIKEINFKIMNAEMPNK